MALARGVLWTEQQLREAKERLAKANAEVERLTEVHRQRIAKSLGCVDPEERTMAASIAGWWEVEA